MSSVRICAEDGERLEEGAGPTHHCCNFCKAEITADDCGECASCAEQRLNDTVNQSAYAAFDDSEDESVEFEPGKAVRVVVTDETGRVLTVCENHGRNLPGGRVFAGEQFSAAAVRKVKEELGLYIEPGRLLDLPDRELAVTPDSDADVKWFRLQVKAESLDRTGGLDREWLIAGPADTVPIDLVHPDQIPLILAVYGRPQQRCCVSDCGAEWICGRDVPQMHDRCNRCEQQKVQKEKDEEQRAYAASLVEEQHLKRTVSSKY